MMTSPQTTRWLHFFLGLCLLIGVLFVLTEARAVSFEDPSRTLGLGTADLKSTVINIINWVLGILGIVAVLLILYGGFVWMTAAGREDRVRLAKRILINAVIGLVIVLLAWAIVNFVFNFGNTVTGPGNGGPCTDGTESGCFDCVAGSWVFDPSNDPSCTLPPDTFEIRNLVTSCENPPDYRDNVFRCSGVSIVFNKLVQTSTVEPRVNDDSLIVEQCGPGSDFTNCNAPSQPIPLFNDTSTFANEIEYSGSSPQGDRAEFVASGKTISFVHAHELFPSDTFFRLTIPKNIQSTNGLNITHCRDGVGVPLPGCVATATTYQWISRVGFNNDEDPPEMRASYPIFDAANPGYPERNVNRNATLWGQFDEAIAPWTVSEANITLAPITEPPAIHPDGTGGTVGPTIDPANYDVFATGNGYELQFTGGFQLDAFHWYEITVQNLADMCTNIQLPPVQQWRFQTNGVGAGIAFVYPPDGFAFSCPDTEIFVQFNTTMYDSATSGCTVAPPLGFVESGTIAPVIPRSFEVEDDYPGFGDPNLYCKKYSFRPVSGLLVFNQPYTAAIDTRYQIDVDGTELKKTWSFSTAADWATCVNPPVIYGLSPNHGSAGACLSVIGNYFDPDGDNQGPADGDDLTFDGTSSTIKNWSQTAIVTEAPDLGLGVFPTPKPVQVAVSYPPPVGPLSSNIVDFTYDSATASTGPCLYQLNPNAGFRGQGYQLVGERFDAASSTKLIHFGAITNPGFWASETVANASVPLAAPENLSSLVSLENDQGESNALPFFVSSVPPDTFQVIDFTPTCSEACPTADVRAGFSQPLDAGSIDNDSVELYKCATPDCDSGLSEVITSLTYVVGTTDVHFPEAAGLAVTSWYRAIIDAGGNGVKSDDGKELGALNFDRDNDGTNDSYSWVFGTAPSADQCQLSYLDVLPVSSCVPKGLTRHFSGRAFSDPNNCNPGGEELNPFLYSWLWSSNNPTYADVQPPIGPNPNVNAEGKQGTITPVEIHGQVPAEGKDDYGLLCVTTSGCVVSSDCDADPTDGLCDGSLCVDNNCTPTVDSISPPVGAVGDWVTVSGCYFDTYIDGSSQVYFLQGPGGGDDRLGLWPLPAICGAPGSTWSDRQIIVEVPNKSTPSPADDVTVTGPLRVIRGTDLKSIDSTQTFDPSGSPTPGICGVTPSVGQAGVTNVKLEGQNFGPVKGPADFVTFHDSQVVPAGDTTWVGENEVQVLTPAAATNSVIAHPWYPNEIELTNDGQGSNLVNYDVIPPACTICSVDTQCGGGGTQGCGTSGPFRCCRNRPTVASYGPTNPPLTCRNAGMTVSFKNAVTGSPMPMDFSTINPSTVKLFNVTNGVPVPLNPGDFRFVSSSSFAVNPGLLGRNKNYKVTVIGDPNISDGLAAGVLSSEKVGMNGDFVWTFTTVDEDNFCQVDHVEVNPSSLLFTTIGDAAPVTAEMYDANGTRIFPVYGLFDWEWQWTSGAPSVATVTQVDLDGDTHVDDVQTVTAVGNGNTGITAKAQAGVGWTGSRQGSVSVRVAACEQPWPSPPPYSDGVTNFSTWYCRDQGGLPVVNAVAGGHVPSIPGEDELLRQFFFENPAINPGTNKHDAVGILVWENENHLSPASWYRKKFGERIDAATFKIDGYEAMRIGTTTYVAGTNLAGGTLYTNIYVLGYNDDAGTEMTAIYNQMLERLKLNINESDFAYGGTTALNALAQVRLDTERYGDVREYEEALALYEERTTAYPDLQAGTYIKGMSTSKWPSWTETFSPELARIAPEEVVTLFDPVNAFDPLCTIPGFEASACWNESTKVFQCAPDSHLYAYQSTGSRYDFFAHFDYGGSGSWITGSVNPCSAPSSCGCFNFTASGIAMAVAPLQLAVRGATTLPAPEKVQAQPDGSSAINLTWDGLTNGHTARSFRILRSSDEKTFRTVGRVSAATTSFHDPMVNPQTTYFYRIQTVGYDGEISPPSPLVSATTSAGPDSIPPDNVRTISVNEEENTIRFAWENPADADFHGLRVFRKEGAQSFSRNDFQSEQIADLEPDQTDYRDEKLESGKIYSYGLFSYDGAANLSSGTFLHLITKKPGTEEEPTPPSNPLPTPALSRPFDQSVQNFRATASDGRVVLTWRVPAGSNISTVVIRRSSTVFPVRAEDGVLVAEVSLGKEILSDMTVLNERPYYYAIFAKNREGTFGPGVFREARPNQRPPEISDVAVPIADIQENDALITWKTDEPATTMVEIGITPDYELGVLLDGALSTNHQFRAQSAGLALTANTLYHFRVSSFDAQGNGTTDLGHVFLTDFRDPQGIIWEGYFESLAVGSWNGAKDQQCDQTCNQFYSCSPAKTPQCDDVRNGGPENPSASKTCGALAIADCLDGSVDLPQGPTGTLNTSFLESWKGSRLGTIDEYSGACQRPEPPNSIRFDEGFWTTRFGRTPESVLTSGNGQGEILCRSTGESQVYTKEAFIIVTPP